MQMKDKRALVIGVSNGLGVVFGKELLRNGVARVLMIDQHDSLCKSQLEQLNEEFGRNRAAFVGCDLTKGSEFDNVFKESVKELGGLDIIINNAAMIDERNFHQSIDTNVTAVFRANMLGVQFMGKDCGGRGGVIVNVASILGLEAFPQLPVYSATNNALIAFSRSFSQPYHYQRTGVRIVVLCPGLTDSKALECLKNDKLVTRLEDLSEAMKDIQPQRPETVAHAVVYVIRCAQNSSIWISEDDKPVYEIQLPDSLPVKSQ
ncbi:15-hydroxyprostaglandin dehydrogenase [NAD(+)]-like [Trichogramma pretiosum]|uniref:15-hydroxyprostaglandin dehydrogenase [NAD(+)]-like n=1 Tax=Trichogramma pretiosum TaxID=7493 RepID=UPI0006C95A42|nr:15-hydroxyprostaglandin dehydrogenase [NAD(+)]-like [Trichogramma pretiosum]